LSLDKWLKPEKEKVPKKKEPAPKAKKATKPEDNLTKQKIKETKLRKFMLICPKVKCKYQKRLIKKQLDEKDYNCPKCKSKMTIKK